MAKTAYINGTILSMVENMPAYTLLVEENGRIAELGNAADFDAAAFDGTVVDLAGKTLMPGFMEVHGHSMQYAEYRLYVDITEEAGVTSIEDMQRVLREHLDTYGVSEGRFLIGNGYDNVFFPGGRHPNKYDLDAVSPEVPIVVLHISGHVGGANSKALELLDYYDGCEDPNMGHLQRLEDGASINGVLEGGAVYNEDVVEKFGKPTLAELADSFIEVQKQYASYGITTATEAWYTEEYARIIQYMEEHDIKNLLEVMAYPYLDFADECLPAGTKQPTPYVKGFRCAGAKYSMDGSPQAKTAWLSKPYYVIPKGKPADYCGDPLRTDEEAIAFFDRCIKNGWSVHVHCNGDAASEQFIRTYTQAMKNNPDIDCSQLRPVMIHCQTVRTDQIERMKEIGMLASVFCDHIWYWGDWHYESVLGPERANRISPLREIADAGINYTLHQDPPICKPNMLFSVHNAVNRTTKGGRVLGEDQKLSVWEALKGITINGAYQCFEEESKGTLEVGKIADLVVLDKNPLETDPTAIKDIKVLETIKYGKVIYRAE